MLERLATTIVVTKSEANGYVGLYVFEQLLRRWLPFTCQVIAWPFARLAVARFYVYVYISIFFSIFWRHGKT